MIAFRPHPTRLIKARLGFLHQRVSNFSDDSSSAASAPPQTSIRAETPAIFPWRHSPSALPRVLDGNDLSGMPNNGRARFVRSALAARELGVGWVQMFLTQSWKDALSSDMKWAFQKGVAALLSQQFKVPLDEIDKEDNGIELNHTGKLPNNWTEEKVQQSETFSEGILEENLRNLYKGIDPESIELVFKMLPLNYRLENAFVIPMISRDIVKERPSLKGAYSAIEAEYSKSKSFSKVKGMGEKLAEDTGHNGIRTIFADVSIDCLETFQIRDVSTGKVLQGSEKVTNEPVTHLVRFEVKKERRKLHGEQLGSWKIIDWDDLLKGNVWH